jgi:hypothetical protein
MQRGLVEIVDLRHYPLSFGFVEPSPERQTLGVKWNQFDDL